MMPHSPLVVYGAAAGTSCKQSGHVWWGGEQDGGAAALAAAAATAAVSWFPVHPRAQQNVKTPNTFPARKHFTKDTLCGTVVVFSTFYCFFIIKSFFSDSRAQGWDSSLNPSAVSSRGFSLKNQNPILRLFF